MNEITIYTNVFTPISVDLEEYDFEGIAKLVLVIKNDYDGECIVREEFAEAGSHQILVSPEQAEKLYNGSTELNTGISTFNNQGIKKLSSYTRTIKEYTSYTSDFYVKF